ncbi:WPP domain-interacting protein 2-like [Curcuma longa]|uniref:WPP domain-interacting protein 2-like n=1 Tax=Curcuma longa TaxID=136217 RepID=UPI003D9DCD4E
MNLGEDSGAGLRGEKEHENAEKVPPLGEIEVKFNGVLDLEEVSHVGCSGGGDLGQEERIAYPAEALVDVKENGNAVGRELSAESPSNLMGSPSVEADPVSGSKSAPSKGYGLRKWRRIRRDLSNDVASIADSAQIHKRRFLVTEPSEANDNRQKNDNQNEDEDSVASLVSMNIGDTPLPMTPTTLDPEFGLSVAAAGFNIGIDSENSDDQSSKSSTAASAPKYRYETIGFGKDRSRAKAIGGKGSGHVVPQRGQRAKGGRSDGNRKLKENSVKIEMENSYSSIESDLRSSNAAFVHMGSVASNSKQSEKSINNNSEPSVSSRRNEEVRLSQVRDLSKEYLDADLSREVNDTKNSSGQQGPELDPIFLESIDSLQTTKEALEKEIQKIEELRKGNTFDDYDSQYEDGEGVSPTNVEANSVELNQKIEHLKWKLGEAIADAKAKELKLNELEAALKSTGVPNKDVSSSEFSILQEKWKEMEMDFENLLEKKIEAEIQYLMMKRTTESWRVLTEDHIALCEEKNIQSEEQSKAMLTQKNFKNKIVMLSKQVEELQEDLSMTKEALRLQRRVAKYSLCLFVQMMILCIALGLFITYVLPPLSSSSSDGVPPT